VAWCTAALLLLTPLVAMQLTEEMKWSALDFAVAGALLFGACAAFELAVLMTGSASYRAAVGVAVAGSIFLVWVNLAVGVIGSEGNPANLMFAGVLAVGLLGALLARFGAPGMARALVATAFAQAAAGVVALVLGSLEGFVLSGFFVGLWLLSAWLFRRAQGDKPTQGAAPQWDSAGLRR
jgi:hypothetical protein